MQVCPPPCRANQFSAGGKHRLRAEAKSLEPERVINLRVPEKDYEEDLAPPPHPPIGPSDGEEDQHLPAVSSPPHPPPSASPSPSARCVVL